MVPCFISMLLCYLLKALHLVSNDICSQFTGSKWLEQQLGGIIAPKGLLLEGLVGNLFTGAATYNAALWTMTYLFWGSIVVIFVLGTFGKLSSAFARLYVYITIIILFLLTSFYNYQFINYVAFVGGMAFADYWTHAHNAEALKRIAPVMLIIGLLLGGFPCGVVPTNGYRYLYFENSFRFWHVFGATLTVVSIFYIKPVKWFLSTPCLRKLGAISFSIYLLHLPILCSLSTGVFLSLIKRGTVYLTATLIVLIITVVTVLGLACLFRIFIELTLNRLLEKGYQKLMKSNEPDVLEDL